MWLKVYKYTSYIYTKIKVQIVVQNCILFSGIINLYLNPIRGNLGFTTLGFNPRIPRKYKFHNWIQHFHSCSQFSAITHDLRLRGFRMSSKTATTRNGCPAMSTVITTIKNGYSAMSAEINKLGNRNGKG